jgi:hypothetical protein
MKNRLYVYAIVTAVVVVLLHFIGRYTEAIRPVLNSLLYCGIFGLVFINIGLFVVPLFAWLWNHHEKQQKEEAKEQVTEEEERELRSLLQGERIGEQEMPRWARNGIAICIGLLIGSGIGFLGPIVVSRIFEI